MFILDVSAAGGAATPIKRDDQKVSGPQNTQASQQATVSKPGESSTTVSGKQAATREKLAGMQQEVEQYRGQNQQQTSIADSKNQEADEAMRSATNNTGVRPAETKEDAESNNAQSDREQQEAVDRATQARAAADAAQAEADVASAQELDATGKVAEHERELGAAGKSLEATKTQEAEYGAEQNKIKASQNPSGT